MFVIALTNWTKTTVSRLTQKPCSAAHMLTTELLGEFRHYVEEVVDDAIVGDVEDGDTGSLLMAMMVSVPFTPAMCWTAPEMPMAM